jgi:hypothetical protein
MLYVTFQKLRERVKKGVGGEKSHAPVLPPTRNV